MTSASNPLHQLGWDEWLDAKAHEKGLRDHRLARVVAVDRDQLLLADESGEFRAKLAGRFLHPAPIRESSQGPAFRCSQGTSIPML